MKILNLFKIFKNERIVITISQSNMRNQRWIKKRIAVSGRKEIVAVLKKEGCTQYRTCVMRNSERIDQSFFDGDSKGKMSFPYKWEGVGSGCIITTATVSIK